jgi:uncharacterized membrane protein YbhN (UPF0104 family)
MQKKRLKSLAAILVILATIAAFVWYLDKHKSIFRQLQHTPLHVVIILLILYLGAVVAIGFTLYATLLLCNLRLNFKEVIQITIYSTVINFFGPLQSGPVFRALYLKKKHNLQLKNYSVATILYYLIYASFSGLFLLSGILKWWTLVLAAFGVAAIYFFLKSNNKHAERFKNLKLRETGILAVATLIQVFLLSVIYFIEVHIISPHVTYDQVLIYTGAANFSLFVALTPGAIGFREAFLVFSRRLHHIDLSTIVAANLIDRCVYIILLTLLVVFIFSSHLNDRVRVKADKKEEDS